MITLTVDTLHPPVNEYHQEIYVQLFAIAQSYAEPLSRALTQASQQGHG